MRKRDRTNEERRAQALRSQMRIVRKPPTAAPADAGGYKPTLQTQRRLGKHPQAHYSPD